MKLLFATGNDYKFYNLQERLKSIPEIELISPKMLNLNIDVIEDGETAVENAIKKAKAYYEVAKMPVLTDDAGLYVDKFSDEEQPGLYVKRVDGIENLSNEEIVDRYIAKLNKYGGESLANYFVGVCLINEDGIINSDSLEEKKFLLTSKKCEKKSMNGAILECISYDLECKKYYDERTLESEDKEFDNKYLQFIKESLSIK